MTVTVVNFDEITRAVYVVLGIDEHEHDQVLGVFNSYCDAKKNCCKVMGTTGFYDLWIEKHSVL